MKSADKKRKCLSLECALALLEVEQNMSVSHKTIDK